MSTQEPILGQVSRLRCCRDLYVLLWVCVDTSLISSSQLWVTILVAQNTKGAESVREESVSQSCMEGCLMEDKKIPKAPVLQLCSGGPAPGTGLASRKGFLCPQIHGRKGSPC